ncbi:MAG: ATP-binding protein [Bacillales bacterium]|nr:ATP-binding protein [Bacillales bacterium]
MNVVHMMIGIQGSGKTTYAKMLKQKLNLSIISSDNVRDERPDLEEKDIFPEVYKRASEILKSGQDIIFDATNITKKVRQRLRDKLSALGCDHIEIIAYYFVPDVALSEERIAKRNEAPSERFLPLEIIAEYAEHIEAPEACENFKSIVYIDDFETEIKKDSGD